MPNLRPPSAQVKGALALALVLPCAALPRSALAADLVVTANRVETESEKLGSAVTIITAEDIERRQALTVADVLRTEPGLAVSSSGGSGRQTAVRIRGAESYHTKVILDGVELSDPSLGQPAYDFAHLLAAGIERIEVVRGPQSLLYGGDAVGGVINIITRRGDGPPKVTGMAEYGSLNTYAATVGLSGSAGRLDYALTAARFATDGISAAAERNGNSERDPYWNDSVTARLGARLTDIWGVEAAGRFMRARVDYDDWTTQPSDDSDRMDKTEWSGRIASDLTVLDGRLKNVVGYSASRSERDIDNGAIVWGSSAEQFDGQMQRLEYQGTARLATDHTLVFGAERKWESTDQSDVSADVANTGVFADYQFSPLESLFLTAGLRLDDHQTFGRHATWRSTAAYLLEATRTRLHGSLGTGFRAPSLYELFHPTYGNANLQAENSRGWDLGVEQTVLDGRLVADVTWFDNRFQDLIQWQSTGYTNVAEARARGLEVTARWTVTDQIRLDGGYTFTDSRDDATGKVLARRPNHQGSLGVAWSPVPRLSAGATVRAVGRQYDSATGATLDAFATVDLRVAYDVTEWAQIYGRIDNLADADYEEVDGYGTLGRTLFAGVRATF